MNTDETIPTPPPVKYGSFTNRMLASTIDLGLLFMIALPLVDLLMGQLFLPVDQDAIMAVLSGSNVHYDSPEFLSRLWKMMREQRIFERMIAENFLQLAFVALYTLPFWFRYSTTPGKMLFKLQIRDKHTGAPMSERQAVIRFFGYVVSIIPFSLGFMWIALSRKRQGFHDIIAGTVVVVKSKPPKPQTSSST